MQRQSDFISPPLTRFCFAVSEEEDVKSTLSEHLVKLPLFEAILSVVFARFLPLGNYKSVPVLDPRRAKGGGLCSYLAPLRESQTLTLPAPKSGAPQAHDSLRPTQTNNAGNRSNAPLNP